LDVAWQAAAILGASEKVLYAAVFFEGQRQLKRVAKVKRVNGRDAQQTCVGLEHVDKRRRALGRHKNTIFVIGRGTRKRFITGEIFEGLINGQHVAHCGAYSRVH
jgi:hypothetical protein